jgi:hypothetical protein
MDVNFQLTYAHKAYLPWPLVPGIHAGMTNKKEMQIKVMYKDMDDKGRVPNP